MDTLIEFAKIVLPAVLVLYAVYLTIKAMISKELKSKAIEYQIENNKTVLPIRLQAFERMSLFLERIHPGSLVVRLNEQGMNAIVFHSILINEIRNELNHNLSQQIYMSDHSWNRIKNTAEEIITLINTAAEKQKEGAKSTDLAKEVVNLYVGKSNDPIQETLTIVKDEIRELF